jgi:DNA polymerase
VYNFTSNEALVERALAIPRTCDDQEIILHCIATKKIVERYRAASPAITRLWRRLGNLLENSIVGGKREQLGPLEFYEGGILLPSGMSLRYPDLRATKDDYGRNQWTYQSGRKRKKVYSGSLTENTVQALARCVMSDAMIELKKLGMHVALTVHDELMIVVKETEAALAEQTMKQSMIRSPHYLPNIPLDATVSCARSYGDAK